MDKHIADLWADALESGTYLKGKGALVQMSGQTGTNKDRLFSATGVLAQLAVAGGYTHRVKKGGKYGYKDSTFSGSTTTKNPLRVKDIPQSVLDFAGMTGTKITVRVGGRSYPTTIETLNDKGVTGRPWSFKSLARLIRNRYADIR